MWYNDALHARVDFAGLPGYTTLFGSVSDAIMGCIKCKYSGVMSPYKIFIINNAPACPTSALVATQYGNQVIAYNAANLWIDIDQNFITSSSINCVVSTCKIMNSHCSGDLSNANIQYANGKVQVNQSPQALFDIDICIKCEYNGGVSKESATFNVKVACQSSPPSGWSTLDTSYSIIIDSASPVYQLSFNTGAEFASSSLCLFKGVYHASDPTSIIPVKPDIFQETKSSYSDSKYVSDLIASGDLGQYSFYLVAITNSILLASSIMSVTIKCGSQVIQKSNYQSVQYGIVQQETEYWQTFTLPVFTSLHGLCGILTYSVSSIPNSVVPFSSPSLLVDQITSESQITISRNEMNGGWQDFKFYIHVTTVGGAEAATFVTDELQLLNPCKAPDLSSNIASAWTPVALNFAYSSNEDDFSYDVSSIFGIYGSQCVSTCSLGLCGDGITSTYVTNKKFVLNARRDVEKGYTLNMCLRCQGDVNVDLDQIQITQTPNCKYALKGGKMNQKYLLYESKTSKPVNLITQGLDEAFGNFYPDECPIQNCTVSNAGSCGVSTSSTEIFMQDGKLFASVSSPGGYSLRICLRCSNGKQISDIDNWTINQCLPGQTIFECQLRSSSRFETISLKSEIKPWSLEIQDGETGIAEFQSPEFSGDGLRFVVEVEIGTVIYQDRFITLQVDKALVKVGNYSVKVIVTDKYKNEQAFDLPLQISRIETIIEQEPLPQVLDPIQELKSQKVVSNPPKRLPKPAIKIGKISPLGIIPIVFNQPFNVPENGLDYSQYLEIGLKSRLDQSWVWGRYQPKSSRLLLESDKKNFGWNVEEQDEMGMNIKVQFENSKEISSSSYGQDEVAIVIRDFSLFQCAHQDAILGPEALTRKCGAKQAICKFMPQIMEDEDKVDSITNVSLILGGSFNFVTVTAVLSSIFIGATIQHLFGLIRIIQILLLSAVIGVVYPAHLTLFYSFLVKFSSIEVIDSTKVYEFIFEFKETEPFNFTFDQYEIEDLNFFMNTGSLMLTIFILVSSYIASSITLFFAKKCFKIRFCRKLGIKADRFNALKIPMQSLFIELYLDILLGSFLNVVAMWREPNFQGLGSYFASFDDFFCSICSIIGLFFSIIAPIYIYYTVDKIKYRLQEAEILEKYGIFYEKFRYQKPFTLVYMLQRRLFLVIILVILTEQPWLQAQLILVSSLISLCYIIQARPYLDKNTNRIEIFNEFTVYVSSLLHLQLIQESDQNDKLIRVKDALGWLVIVNVTFNIIINTGIAAVQTLFDLYHELLSLKKSILQRYRTFRSQRASVFIHDSFPEIFPAPDFSEQQAIAFCKSFSLERNWCFSHGIDYRVLDDERIFQEYLIKYNYLKKRQQIEKEMIISQQLIRSRDGEIHEKIQKSREVIPLKIKKLPSSIRSINKTQGWRANLEVLETIQEEQSDNAETERKLERIFFPKQKVEILSVAEAKEKLFVRQTEEESMQQLQQLEQIQKIVEKDKTLKDAVNFKIDDIKNKSLENKLYQKERNENIIKGREISYRETYDFAVDHQFSESSNSEIAEQPEEPYGSQAEEFISELVLDIVDLAIPMPQPSQSVLYIKQILENMDSFNSDSFFEHQYNLDPLSFYLTQAIPHTLSQYITCLKCNNTFSHTLTQNFVSVSTMPVPCSMQLVFDHQMNERQILNKCCPNYTKSLVQYQVEGHLMVIRMQTIHQDHLKQYYQNAKQFNQGRLTRFENWFEDDPQMQVTVQELGEEGPLETQVQGLEIQGYQLVAAIDQDGNDTEEKPYLLFYKRD